RRRDHALTVGTGDHQAELAGHRHELALGGPAGLPRLSVARGRDEGGGDPPSRTCREQFEVGAGGRADEDQVDPGPRGEVVDRGHRFDTEDRPTLAVRGVDLAGIALAEDVVQRDEAELARMARGTGNDDSAGVEQRPELLRPRTGCGHVTSTNASTATGR